MNLKRRMLAACLFATSSACLADDIATVEESTVIRAADVQWKPLNPKRGNRGPQAGTLWGDQTKDEASGFLVKFVDGFSSPPHIHNITYRGIVVAGHLHNDDPAAAPMWMPAGSYWTQPAGEVHITSSRGSSVAYVEIQSGPYLVMPADRATDNGERPVNVDASNVIWLDAASTAWGKRLPAAAGAKGPEIAFLWGKPEPGELNGTMLKLPAGFRGQITSDDSLLRVIVIEVSLGYQAPGAAAPEALSPGSALALPAESAHRIQVGAEGECVVYVRTVGRYQIASAVAAD